MGAPFREYEHGLLPFRAIVRQPQRAASSERRQLNCDGFVMNKVLLAHTRNRAYSSFLQLFRSAYNF